LGESKQWEMAARQEIAPGWTFQAGVCGFDPRLACHLASTF